MEIRMAKTRDAQIKIDHKNPKEIFSEKLGNGEE